MAVQSPTSALDVGIEQTSPSQSRREHEPEKMNIQTLRSQISDNREVRGDLSHVHLKSRRSPV
jgi:hypothetical protein